MTKPQQDVVIYNEGFTSAQRKFEKDLKKHQLQGWRLISVTPTQQKMGRTQKLTAIYERENNAINDVTDSPVPYMAPTSEASILLQSPIHPINPPQPKEEILATQTTANLPEQDSSAILIDPLVPEVEAPEQNISLLPISSLPYSRKIFLWLVAALIISILCFSVGISSNHINRVYFSEGIGLLGGVIVSILIIDWKGLLTIDGWLKWRQMSNLQRVGMVFLLYSFFSIFLFIYVFRTGLKVLPAGKEWDAPGPVKKRAKIGMFVGVVTVIVLFAGSITNLATDTQASNTSTLAASSITQVTKVPQVVKTSHKLAVPALKPTPTQKPKPTPTPLPTPVPYAHFDDGTFIVGKDIQPGTYRTRDASIGCYYARLKGFGGSVDDIIANNNTDAPSIVKISGSDAGFESNGCGTWTKDLSAITTSKTTFSDGMYIVGTDIKPGTYKSSGQSGCYYARLSGFGNTTDDILANDNTDTPAIVTISSDDAGFQSNGCGTWSRI